MKVYIVTTGDYDEFAVHSIWTTAEAANAAVIEGGLLKGYWGDRTQIIVQSLDAICAGNPDAIAGIWGVTA